jgi:hypothetical protein
MRAIEQRLAAELQVAKESSRVAKTAQEKQIGSEALDRALQRFLNFAANRSVPEDLL